MISSFWQEDVDTFRKKQYKTFKNSIKWIWKTLSGEACRPQQCPAHQGFPPPPQGSCAQWLLMTSRGCTPPSGEEPPGPRLNWGLSFPPQPCKPCFGMSFPNFHHSGSGSCSNYNPICTVRTLWLLAQARHLFMKLPRRGREPKQQSRPFLAATLPKAGCSMSCSEASTPAPSNPRMSDNNTQKESNTKDFQCDRCPRKFTRRENLARHAKSRGSTILLCQS